MLISNYMIQWFNIYIYIYVCVCVSLLKLFKNVISLINATHHTNPLPVLIDNVLALDPDLWKLSTCYNIFQNVSKQCHKNAEEVMLWFSLNVTLGLIYLLEICSFNACVKVTTWNRNINIVNLILHNAFNDTKETPMILLLWKKNRFS